MKTALGVKDMSKSLEVINERPPNYWRGDDGSTCVELAVGIM